MKKNQSELKKKKGGKSYFDVNIPYQEKPYLDFKKRKDSKNADSDTIFLSNDEDMNDNISFGRRSNKKKIIRGKDSGRELYERMCDDHGYVNKDELFFKKDVSEITNVDTDKSGFELINPNNYSEKNFNEDTGDLLGGYYTNDSINNSPIITHLNNNDYDYENINESVGYNHNENNSSESKSNNKSRIYCRSESPKSELDFNHDDML